MTTITLTARDARHSLDSLARVGVFDETLSAPWIGLLRFFDTFTCAGVPPVSAEMDLAVWGPIIAATGDAIAEAMGS